MTAPFTPLPPKPVGSNLLQDLSRAGGSFVGGLLAEKRARREEALAAALAQARLLQAQQGPRPFHLVTPTATGMQHRLVSPTGQEVPLPPELQAAPESQYFFPTEDEAGRLSVGAASRYRPGVAATTVPMGPGMQPRSEAPIIGTTETPTGAVTVRTPRRGGQSEVVTAPGGGPMMRPAQEGETRTARDAFEMIQGYKGMQQAAEASPGKDVYDDVAKFWATQSIVEGVPLVGRTLQSVVQAAQNVLSPEASQYFTSLIQFAAARAFSRGGATLTKNEIDYALSAHAPRISDPENVRQQKDVFTKGAIQGAIQRSGSAWQRFSNLPDVEGWGIGPAGPEAPGQFDKFLRP
jgi:hypothetical protein